MTAGFLFHRGIKIPTHGIEIPPDLRTLYGNTVSVNPASGELRYMGVPEKCVTVRTYAEYRDDIKRFADGKYQFLIVVGGPGIGKSESIRQTIPGGIMSYEGGKPTPYQFFCDLYDFKDCVVLLDDMNTKFYTDHTTNSYLKVLTDTRAVKTLHWKTAQLSESTTPPNMFETSSRVVILCNDWDKVNEHVRAIESRAFAIHFDPSPTEVHLEVGRGNWFKDAEVYDWIWEHRRLITKPDMRFYKKIAEQKAAGANWQKRGLEMLIGDEKMQAVATLLEDESFTSNKKRAEKFVELGYGGRTTFYDCLAHFRFYMAAQAEKMEKPELGKVAK